MVVTLPSDHRTTDAPGRFGLELERIRLGVMSALCPSSEAHARLVRLDATLAATDPGAARALRERLGVEADDMAFLWFVVAWATDPLLTPYAYSLTSDPRVAASLSCFARVSPGWEPARVIALAQRVLEASHPFAVSRLLIATSIGPPDPSSAFRAAARLIAFLRGDNAVDSSVNAMGGIVEPPVLPVIDASSAVIERVVSVLESPQPAIAILEGQTGVGRRTLAALAAARLGKRLIHVDLTRLPRGGSIGELLGALLRERVFSDALPMIVGVETTRGEDLDAVARRAALGRVVGQLPCTLVLASTDPAVEIETRRAVVRIKVDIPDAETRQALWRRTLGDGDVPAPELGEVALRFRLTPSGIERAAAAARLIAHERRATTLEVDDVYEGVRLSLHESLGAIAQRLTPRHAWADLVVPDDTREEIEQLVMRARYAYRVLHEWGYERHVSASGMAVLFSGPPGTGKTMVAGLMARELGLDLYRVDLSQVISKWVGETEKQLAKVFDAAETGHALLLFDEADALFAKRTEVKGATERYANLEVNYLLQRIEAMNGVAILTTNMDSSIDDAFRRRLASHIVFQVPGEEERELLFRSLIPSTAPTSGLLDLRSLAEQYSDFTGGHIRNVTLRAAFLAAADEVPIQQEHLVRAARDEARAMGRIFHSAKGTR